MFFADPVAAFAALHAAARASAALVFSCFRSPAHNPWASEIVEAVTGAPPIAPRDDAPGPFAFADRGARRRHPRRRRLDARSPPRRSITPNRAGEGADPVADAVSFFSRIGPARRSCAPLLAEQRDAMLARLADVVRASPSWRHRGLSRRGMAMVGAGLIPCPTGERTMTIIVHHLENSRSQRILWMLEELGLPYEVKRYEREHARRCSRRPS